MKKIKILLPSILLLAATIAGAQNSPSAGNQKYDGLYDRPSYYPNYVQRHDWPTNMSCFAKVRIDGEDAPLSNYEIAVFDQHNQLRSIGRSIAGDDDVCTLTILGEEGDTFHFYVIYGNFDSPKIARVQETCAFSTNAMIGDFITPLWLTAKYDPTAVRMIRKTDRSTAAVFNIKGQKCNGMTHRGVYIVNGKKIIK